MKTKKLTLAAVLTSLALILFVVEAQIPPVVPIAGIKLGLANIVTLITLYLLDRKTAGAVLLCRILLGSLFAGNAVSLIYSAAGGLLCFIVMASVYKIMGEKLIFAVSVLGAVAHNTAQLVAAAVIGGKAMFLYAPVLIISAIVTGSFTGITAYFIVKYAEKLLPGYKN